MYRYLTGFRLPQQILVDVVFTIPTSNACTTVNNFQIDIALMKIIDSIKTEIIKSNYSLSND